jgi:hypothetical protein
MKGFEAAGILPKVTIPDSGEELAKLVLHELCVIALGPSGDKRPKIGAANLILAYTSRSPCSANRSRLPILKTAESGNRCWERRRQRRVKAPAGSVAVPVCRPPDLRAEGTKPPVLFPETARSRCSHCNHSRGMVACCHCHRDNRDCISLDFGLSRRRERSYSGQANERVGPPFVVTRLDLKPMEACSCHRMISKEF